MNQLSSVARRVAEIYDHDYCNIHNLLHSIIRHVSNQYSERTVLSGTTPPLSVLQSSRPLVALFAAGDNAT